MENVTIKTIDIRDFQPLKSRMDYLDNDILVSDKLENIPVNTLDKAFRINFFLLVACEEGEMHLQINGDSYQMKENDILIVLPTMLISDVKRSEKHTIRMVGFSTNFLHRILKKDRNTERMFYSVYKKPIRSTDGRDANPLAHHYMALIISKIRDTNHYYRHEALQYLFSALFCEMMNELKSHLGDEETGKPDKSLRRAHQVFRQFLLELSRDGGMHRSVNYFADRLCYSPKYVSSVVKQVSGRTALDWINEYAMDQIKVQLKHSDLSIKEIADRFNFANQSFFGKYVKAHVGTSPAKYRAMPDD